MISKLNGLSTETLEAMQVAIVEIFKLRLDTDLRAGREASYEYNGIMHVCRIVRINHKTANVVEISPIPGRQVRVGIQMLKVKPIERKMAMSLTKPAVPHKPASYAGDSW